MTHSADLVAAGDEMTFAIDALWAGLYAIQPNLETPFGETGEWTLWTRFVAKNLARCERAAADWRAARNDGSGAA